MCSYNGWISVYLTFSILALSFWKYEVLFGQEDKNILSQHEVTFNKMKHCTRCYTWPWTPFLSDTRAQKSVIAPSRQSGLLYWFTKFFNFNYILMKFCSKCDMLGHLLYRWLFYRMLLLVKDKCNLLSMWKYSLWIKKEVIEVNINLLHNIAFILYFIDLFDISCIYFVKL